MLRNQQREDPGSLQFMNFTCRVSKVPFSPFLQVSFSASRTPLKFVILEWTNASTGTLKNLLALKNKPLQKNNLRNQPTSENSSAGVQDAQTNPKEAVTSTCVDGVARRLPSRALSTRMRSVCLNHLCLSKITASSRSNPKPFSGLQKICSPKYCLGQCVEVLSRFGRSILILV